MTALQDDCFEFGGDLTPLGDALALLAERVGPVTGTETVGLRDALNRALAEDIVADRDVPPQDNAAVDGYAVYFEDLSADTETRLPIGGRVAAGHSLDGAAERGAAIRVFTGAAMPGGPDTIFMQEDVDVDGADVILKPGIKRGANRRHAGEDVRRGSTILHAGRRLRAQEIGLAASVGRARVKVYKPLKVCVFSTGDEIRDVDGAAPPAGCIYDSNRYSIMGLLEGMGARVTDLGILPDDRAAITGALSGAAKDHDLIVTSGGVSLGEEDHVKEAVQGLGSLHFWRLAIKPGRPIAMGQVDGTAFLGLPGNPVAVMVTLMVIGRPLALLLSGFTGVRPAVYRVKAGFAMDKKAGRREWLRASLVRGADGGPVARRFAAGGAGILTSMVESDGLVELAEDTTAVAEGAMVDFLPFNEVLR